MPNEVPVVMPKMSMTMETGELLSWEIQEGDTVRAGDVVAVVQTDKVDMEVEAPVDGTLLRTVAETGAVVPVGEPLGYLSSETDSLMGGVFDDDDDDDSAAESKAADTDTAVDDAVPDAPTPAPGSASGDAAHDDSRPADDEVVATAPSRQGPLPAVPKARRLAAQLKVVLADVKPTGPNGVITLHDVEQAAEKSGEKSDPPAANGKPKTPSTSEAEPAATTPVAESKQEPKQDKKPAPDASSDPGFADALAPRRRAVRSAVAKTMTRSAAVPQFTAFAEIDLENLQRARDGVGWTTLLIRALARALRANPTVLAGWNDAQEAPAETPGSCGVSLAIDTAVGLLAPVVRDADTTPVRDLDATIRTLIERGRSGKLTMADLQGGHTTLSNLGGFGVPSFTSLLTPPQASALSVGAIAQRPVVHHGGIAVRLGVTVGLTVDHRAVDGADAARVLDQIRTLCADPEVLLG